MLLDKQKIMFLAGRDFNAFYVKKFIWSKYATKNSLQHKNLFTFYQDETHIIRKGLYEIKVQTQVRLNGNSIFMFVYKGNVGR